MHLIHVLALLLEVFWKAIFPTLGGPSWQKIAFFTVFHYTPILWKLHKAVNSYYAVTLPFPISNCSLQFDCTNRTSWKRKISCDIRMIAWHFEFLIMFHHKISHLPSTIYRLLSTVSCLSSIVHQLLYIFYRLLSIIYRLLSIINHLSSIIYHLSSIIYHLSSIIYHLLFIIYHLSSTVYSLSSAYYYMLLYRSII